jgi:hypothetical protein
MPETTDNEQPANESPVSARMVIPSLDDVIPHLREASASGIGLRGSVTTRDLGGGVVLVVLDLGAEYGLVAQIADFPSIYLMTARYMSVNAAAFTIAQEILEPGNWITVDRPTADALLNGDPQAIERVFEA